MFFQNNCESLDKFPKVIEKNEIKRYTKTVTGKTDIIFMRHLYSMLGNVHL